MVESRNVPTSWRVVQTDMVLAEKKAIWRALQTAALAFTADSGRNDDPVGRLALIEVSGEDRLEWLQGQVTNDLRGLSPGSGIDFCLLKPTGQIVADCRMWVFEDRWLISTPKVCVPTVLKRFDDMVIMEDVAARDVTGGYELILIQGPKAREELERLFHPNSPSARSGGVDPEGVKESSPGLGEATSRDGAPEIVWTPEGSHISTAVPGAFILPSDRSGFGGFEFWVERGEPFDRAMAALADIPNGDPQSLFAASLVAGIPFFGLDMDDKTLLPEMGLAFTACNVSYTKGCYTGQEIVARIHSRGHTNRTWVALASDKTLAPGATVATKDRPDAGRVTRTAYAPAPGHIAGAMLRNEAAEEGAEVTVLLENGPVIANVRHFPLAL